MQSLKEVDVHRNLDRSLYYKGKAANLRMLNTLLPKMQRQRQNDIDIDKDRQTFNHAQGAQRRNRKYRKTETQILIGREGGTAAFYQS